MVPGFNHNIKHKGNIYHIQTEDSGVKAPHIITLLYLGGTILSSEKTSYADILRIDNLATVVRELMEEQHKKMLKKLISGAFDCPKTGPEPSQAPATPPLTKEDEESKFGKDLISDMGLDEVVLNFLSSGIDKKS